MRAIRRVALAVVAGALIVPLPAIGSTSAQPAGVPMVQVAAEGGFVAPGVIKTAMPSLLVYGNGSALTALDSTRPDMRAMRLHTVDKVKVRALATAVAKAAVPPKGGWGTPGVADVPNTHIVIRYSGIRRDLSVYALSFTTGGNVTPAQATARKALAKALQALTDSVQRAPGAPWRPARYEAWTFAKLFTPTGIGMANPASLFCESMGGKVQIVTDAAGQRGDCLLPNGTRTDEWTYFRSVSPTLSTWPATVPAPTAACTVVQEADFRVALRGANPTGHWLLATGQAPAFTFRPVLPGEVACVRDTVS